MGTMSEKDIRVQEHIDEFLTRVAARWEEGCDTDRWELGADPGEKLALLADAPETEGDISYGDIISELRRRVSDPEEELDDDEDLEDDEDEEDEVVYRNVFVRWIVAIAGFAAMIFFWQGPEPFFRAANLIDRRGITEGVQGALGNRIDREDPWWVRMDSLRSEADAARIRYEHAWDDYWDNRGTPFPEPEISDTAITE